MKRTKILFSVFLSLLTYSSWAYNERTGSISGRTIDSVSMKPVEYTAISLISEENDKVVNGTTTDVKGEFKLTDVAPGSYKIQFYFLGYQTIVLDKIVLSASRPDVVLGEIKLVSKSTRLKEVTVSTEKSIIENKIDRTVYNVDQDITSQGGVATDVLKKVPQVSVDVDGNVELQGSTGIRFLINGKPSTIFGNNINDVLQSIPASQLQSIEVITSPGAKYDAEGTAGIINIILKRSTAEGINGNVSLSVGTRLENGSFNLNAHHNNFGINAFVSGNAQLTSQAKNSLNSVSIDEALMQKNLLTQNGTTGYNRNGYLAGVGFDWDVSSNDNLSGSFGYDYFGNSNTGTMNRQTENQDMNGNTLSVYDDEFNTTNKFHENAFDCDLVYQKSFEEEDQELEISATGSFGKNYSYYRQEQMPVATDSVVDASYGDNPGTEDEIIVGVDYRQPLTEDALIEAGAKLTTTKISSTSDVYLLNSSSSEFDYNTTMSSVLDYQDYVYAGYVSSTIKFPNAIETMAGIRYEYTQTNAWFSNSGDLDAKPYGTVVPTCIVSYPLKKNQTIKIGYSRRIERPDYRDLNPFINASDPKNISMGNKNLRPEIGDKIEFSYIRNFEKGTTINTTLFYRGMKDDIQSYVRYYSAYAVGDSTYYNVAVSTRENVGRENNFGINLFISVPATSKINLRSNISCYERYIINGALPGEDIHGFSYRINLNAAYEVTKSISVELFGNFSSQRINTQGKYPSFTTYNFAFRKQLFHKKGSIAFTATNPFKKYVTQKTELEGENFTSTAVRELPYQSFGINFTYKFGKLEFKNEKEMEDVNLTNPPSEN